jgi:hypothetical protein
MSDFPIHRKDAEKSNRTGKLMKMPIIAYIFPFSRPLLFLIVTRATIPQSSDDKAKMGKKGKRKHGNTKGNMKLIIPIIHRKVNTWEAVTHLDV